MLRKKITPVRARNLARNTLMRIESRKKFDNDDHYLAMTTCDLPPEVEALRHGTDDPHDPQEVSISCDL